MFAWRYWSRARLRVVELAHLRTFSVSLSVALESLRVTWLLDCISMRVPVYDVRCGLVPLTNVNKGALHQSSPIVEQMTTYARS